MNLKEGDMWILMIGMVLVELITLFLCYSITLGMMALGGFEGTDPLPGTIIFYAVINWLFKTVAVVDWMD